MALGRPRQVAEPYLSCELASRVACSHVLPRRHHRRDRDAAGPRRDRRRPRQRTGGRARSRARASRSSGRVRALTRALAPPPHPRVHGGSAIDRAVVTFFPAPHSYTGEDVLEISAHGSPVLLRGIVEAAMRAGARLAEPGEFTFRAFLHGRIDLVQAEAVAGSGRCGHAASGARRLRSARRDADGEDPRDRRARSSSCPRGSRRRSIFRKRDTTSSSPGGARGDSRRSRPASTRCWPTRGAGRLMREGAQVVILGRPNAGKSSLFNRLAGAGRAIVTDIPGTTRDLVTEVVDIDGRGDHDGRHRGTSRCTG